MGQLVVRVKVMPENAEISMSYLLDNIKKGLEPLKMERVWEEPVAFGLKALVFDILIPDEEGSADKLERRLSQIEGVGSITVLGVGRYSTRI